jgi:hypothetical protein
MAALISFAKPMDKLSNKRIAILVPCYNEALTITAIARDFNACLPQAQLALRMPVAEVSTLYKSHSQGSVSKLNTYRDGVRILGTIFRLFKSERPLAFYAIGTFLAALLSTILAEPLVATDLGTGLVPRPPTAILCASLMLAALILLACGIMRDAVTKGRIAQKRFAYLSKPGPSFDEAAP